MIVFDYPRALEQFGDSEFLEEILNLSLDEIATLGEEGRSAVADGDPATVTRIAHRLKGSLAQIGAEEARELAHIVESAARDGSTEDIGKLWGRLDAALQRLTAALVAVVG